MDNNYIKNAYYLMIREGYNSSALDEALLNLLVVVLKNRNYGSLPDYSVLVDDFKSIIGFELPYFPMKRIIALAIKETYLVIDKSAQNIIVDYTKVRSASCMPQVIDRQRNIEELVTAFDEYLASFGVSYTKEELFEMLDHFIDAQGVTFYNDKKLNIEDTKQDYLFARFLIADGNQKYYNLIDEMVTGRLLSELVTQDVLSEEQTVKFDNTCAYIDADIIFMLLGIDELKRKSIYEDLISDMKKAGIKVKVFRHTCEEVAKSITKSLDWINNRDYEESLATKTTIYFVNNGVSAEEIEEIALTLDSKLKKLEIEIDDMGYPDVPEGRMHQEDYYDAIKQYYCEKDPYLEDEDLRTTIDNDAKSFLYIQTKNSYNETTRITGLKNIFVTCNNSLSRVSRRIMSDKSSIPFCLTDTFVGALIWKDNPTSFEKQSKQKIANFIYQAFLPNRAISAKFSEIVDNALEHHEITDEEFALLKRNKAASNMVMEITEGNIDLVDEKLPQEVLKRISNESYKKGRQEERIEADKQLAEKDKCISSKERQIGGLEIDLAKERIKNAENSKNNKESEKERKTRKQKRISIFLGISFVLLAVLVVLGVILFANRLYDMVFISNTIKSEKIEFFISAGKFVCLIVSAALILVFGKIFNIKKFMLEIRTKILDVIMRKFECSDYDIEQIDFQIKQLEDEIKYYNNIISSAREKI